MSRNQSKKHHFVPQSILRNFSIENKEKRIFVYDKKDDKTFPSSITDAGSENYFNTIREEFDQLNLESIFQKCDDTAAYIINKIVQNNSLEGLDLEDFYLLAVVTSIQLQRTKLVRTTLEYISMEQRRFVEEICSRSDKFTFDETKNRILSENEIKLITILGAFDINKSVESLLAKGIYLVENMTNSPFWISDNPVVIHNDFPYGSPGIFEEGVEIYFPLSSSIIAVFSCKSILRKMEQAEEFKILDSSGKAYLDAVKYNKNFKILSNQIEQVEFYNQQQVLNSSRYIYSQTNDFALAKDTIKAIPAAKEIRSKIKFGGMGKGPPPTPNLPMGEILVIYGKKNHHMMPIKILDDQIDLKFTALPTLAFQMILNDAPYKRAFIYRDQLMSRLMGQPKITPIDLAKGIFLLSHSDDGIAKILKETRKSR